MRNVLHWLTPLALGTVLILPGPGGDSMTFGPNGTTYSFRDESGNSMIFPPGGGTIYDFDNGGGNHMTLIPGQAPIYTFGDGDDEGEGDGE